jgi:hypothetical protein
MTADKAGHGVIDNKLVMDINMLRCNYVLRCNSATVSARRPGGVNGPKSVAICRQFYVRACECVKSLKKLLAGTRPGLLLIPRILNQSELPSLHNARRFSE